MNKLPIAYQLFCVRHDAQKDFEGTIRKVAALGFHGVEFAGFFGRSAKDIKALMEETGLVPVSSHVPYDAIKADPFGIIAYHQAIGCPYIVIPYLDNATRPGAAGFAKAASDILNFAKLCKKADIQLLYHNHDFEFCMLSGQYGLDFLYDLIPSSLLQCEIDTCWVKFAGVDPAAYLRRYSGRIPLVHLKDFIADEGAANPYELVGQAGNQVEKRHFEYRPLGHGCQNMAEVTTAALEGGAKWFIVEQDDPSSDSPYEDAKLSLNTLRKLGLLE